MTAKEELRLRVEEMDEAEAARLLAQLSLGNGVSNGHGHDARPEVADNPVWREFLRTARATPPEERTPFQALALTPRPRSATGGEDIDEITRRTLDQIAQMPPFTLDDPLWDFVGMVKRKPGEPLTNVAENHDKYLAEAYADLHEDDEPS